PARPVVVQDRAARGAHGEDVRPPAPPDTQEERRRAPRLRRPARPVVVQGRAAHAHAQLLRPAAPPATPEHSTRALPPSHPRPRRRDARLAAPASTAVLHACVPHAPGATVRPHAPPSTVHLHPRAARPRRPPRHLAARHVVVPDCATTAHGEDVRPPAPPDTI